VTRADANGLSGGTGLIFDDGIRDLLFQFLLSGGMFDRPAGGELRTIIFARGCRLGTVNPC